MKGPFVVKEGLMPCAHAGDGNYQILVPEPEGGALIVFFWLLEEQANDICTRLNDAVQFWIQREEVLQQ